MTGTNQRSAPPAAGQNAKLPPLEPSAVRVATWNCRMGLDRKRAALAGIDADVLVLPEAQLGFIPDPGQRLLFKGRLPGKGLGVLVRDPYTACVSPADPGLPWLLAVDVWRGRELLFTVLAAWTVKEAGDRRPSYAAQTQQALEAWQHAATREGRDPWARVIMGGDFNASFQGPSTHAHQQTVARLHQAGMASVHHQVTGQDHGQEQAHTLRWIGPGRTPYEYHCDYLWLSTDLQPTLTAGGVASMADWVDNGLSDHVPVWSDLRVESGLHASRSAFGRWA